MCNEEKYLIQNSKLGYALRLSTSKNTENTNVCANIFFVTQKSQKTQKKDFMNEILIRLIRLNSLSNINLFNQFNLWFNMYYLPDSKFCFFRVFRC